MAVTLEMLGELMRQMQADMRTIRAEVEALRDDVNRLHMEPGAIIRAVGEMMRASELRLMDRLAAFEARVETRIDRQEG